MTNTNFGPWPQPPNTQQIDQMQRDDLIEKSFDLEDQIHAEKVREAIFEAPDAAAARLIWWKMVYKGGAA